MQGRYTKPYTLYNKKEANQMKQIRIRQLLNLYNRSYTNRERWQAKSFEALDKQHIKAAIKADTAAHYWDSTKNRLYVSLLIASPLQS